MDVTKLFIGWYDYSQEEYKEILKNGLISCDTNILLNMYRYSKEAATSVFNSFNSLKEKIITPYYIVKEFTNNRKNVRIGSIREYENLESKIEKLFGDISAEFDNYGERKLSKYDKISQLINNCKIKCIDYISNEKNQKNDFYKTNEIEKNIFEIFFHNTISEYSEDEFQKIKEEGIRRFEKEIPPGYKDNGKEENGDYYIFKSLIDYCKQQQKDLIFVTNDKKEDWFREIKGIKEPREELLNEFYKETGHKLIIMDFDTFIKNDVIFIDKPKISSRVADEIQQINMLSEKSINRISQRIQRYINLNSKYNTLTEIIDNIDEIKKNYRTISRIISASPDDFKNLNIEKLMKLLESEKYNEYITELNKLNLHFYHLKNIRNDKIKTMYYEYIVEKKPEDAIILLEKMIDYMKDYSEETYDNRVLLSNAREVRNCFRHGIVSKEILSQKIIEIFNLIFEDDSNYVSL